MTAPSSVAAARSRLISDIAELEALSDSLLAVECRSSLRAFAHEFWSEVEPDRDIAWNWHLDELCAEMERLFRGEGDPRLLVAVPPGTMKTLLCSVMFRAWVWANDHAARFLAGCYGSHLSIRDNVRLRTIVTSAKFRRLFPDFQLSTGGVERLDSMNGGWSIATSVGGIGTGEHPDFVIVDDAITEAQSRSDVERASACAWIDRTLSTRGIARKVRTLVIGQRLHISDPYGHLEAKGWVGISFPMRYEPARAATDVDPGYKPDRRDKRTTPGELLWPALIDEAKVRQVELDLGPFGTASQLQQQPAKETGGLFQRQWFTVVDTLPGTVVRRVRGWDDAGTEGGGCYTAGVRLAECKVGKDEYVFVVEHVVRDQLGPDNVERLIKETAVSDGRKTCAQREEKEGGSAGLAVVASRTRLLQGFDYQGVVVTGDKVTRAKPYRTQCEGRRVLLLRGEWNAAYLDELASFPNGRYKDQVDASSTAFNTLLLEPRKVRSALW